MASDDDDRSFTSLGQGDSDADADDDTDANEALLTADPKALSLWQLKARCRIAGLPVSGSRQDLLARVHSLSIITDGKQDDTTGDTPTSPGVVGSPHPLLVKAATVKSMWRFEASPVLPRSATSLTNADRNLIAPDTPIKSLKDFAQEIEHGVVKEASPPPAEPPRVVQLKRDWEWPCITFALWIQKLSTQSTPRRWSIRCCALLNIWCIIAFLYCMMFPSEIVLLESQIETRHISINDLDFRLATLIELDIPISVSNYNMFWSLHIDRAEITGYFDGNVLVSGTRTDVYIPPASRYMVRVLSESQSGLHRGPQQFFLTCAALATSLFNNFTQSSPGLAVQPASGPMLWPPNCTMSLVTQLEISATMVRVAPLYELQIQMSGKQQLEWTTSRLVSCPRYALPEDLRPWFFVPHEDSPY